jgi:hypothetical protein
MVDVLGHGRRQLFLQLALIEVYLRFILVHVVRPNLQQSFMLTYVVLFTPSRKGNRRVAKRPLRALIY